MPGTDPTTRAPQPRRFENYILSKTTDLGSGLTEIPDLSFTPVLCVNGNAGPGTDDDGWSDPLPIGFPFQFDNITYTHYVVDTNGWLALVDPSTGTFAIADVMAPQPGPAPEVDYDNASIQLTNVTQTVLLAPWFDNLHNVVNDLSLLTAPLFNFGAEKLYRLLHGIETPPEFYNQVAHGPMFFFDAKNKKGRRLIVRWTSISSVLSSPPVSVLRFEVVLYENGTIEFRYGPKPKNTLTTPVPDSAFDGATIGIFMPGTNRFRDFSTQSGYREDTRQEYTYGGFIYDASYTDTSIGGVTAAYAVNLLPTKHWPGLSYTGCTTTFSPPVNRRKVLPRQQIRERDARQIRPHVMRTGDSRTGMSLSYYDDRRTAPFISGSSSSPLLVNYPTTLPRFFGGNTPGTLERQDLFAGDFLVPGAITNSAIDPYVNERPEMSIEPFNETSLVEQASSSLSDTYFQTGTIATLFDASFTQPLKSKTQIRFSLPVHYNVQMPGVTSSIYYYNLTAHTWQVPNNSTYTLNSSSAVPDAGSKGDWSNPASWHGLGLQSRGYPINEDARGFGPFGNPISSGSHTPDPVDDVAAFGDKTDYEIMRQYNQKLVASALGKSYAKSVRNNPEYQPTNAETFKVKTATPFLLEKAVIEIPIAAGPGWFDDQTQCWKPSTSAGDHAWGVQMSGPAMTVALFRKSQAGKHVGNEFVSSSLDLILTGTIIPHGDDISQPVLRQNGKESLYNYYVMTPVGFRTAGHPAGAVVQPDASSYFTGSVSVKTEALSSVGVMLVNDRTIVFNDAFYSQVTETYNFLENTPTLDLNAESGTSYIAGISPFGRAATGLRPCGRSVLGRELSTLQRRADPGGQFVPNPYYLGSGALGTTQYAYISNTLEDIKTQISNLEIPRIKFLSAISLFSHSPCPYLLMPGDELVLSISKMHPFMNSGSFNDPWLSGSMVPHDVQLISGNINITLYGSLIAENAAFNDPLNQELGSDTASEIIGAEAVLDQFDVPDMSELSGSYIDLVFSGTFSSTGGEKFVIGSNFNSADPTVGYPLPAAYVGDELYEQRWLSQAFRNTVHVSTNERFYDTLVPSVDDVMTLNSPGSLALLKITTGGSLLGGSNVNFPVNQLLGYYVDNLWTMGYPFEPRYSGLSRKLNLNKITVTRDGDGNVISPVTRDTGALICFTSNILDGNGGHSGIIDLTTAGAPQTATGLRNNDFLKVFYGFGDHNNKNPFWTSAAVVPNHFPTVRWGINIDFANPGKYWVGVGIRGWKYGVMTPIPTFSKSVWRRDRFGQFRDMLEQRHDSKFFDTVGYDSNGQPMLSPSTLLSPVQVRFVDSTGKITKPEFTMSSNLSFEATSSVPYTDGVVRNRENPISFAKTNQSIVVI